MSVRVPWNTGVTQVDNELVSLSISEHESLVGDFAVASKPLEGFTQRPRRCHDVIKQPDFARIEIAGQREAKAIVLQSARRLVQKPDLTLHAQSLLRLGDRLRR